MIDKKICKECLNNARVVQARVLSVHRTGEYFTNYEAAAESALAGAVTQVDKTIHGDNDKLTVIYDGYVFLVGPRVYTSFPGRDEVKERALAKLTYEERKALGYE